MTQPFNAKNQRGMPVLPCFLLLVTLLALSSCSSSHKTTLVPTPPPAPMLQRNLGQEVLYLTNKPGSSAKSSGAFSSDHKPYWIELLCTGNGTLAVATTQTIPGLAGPQLLPPDRLVCSPTGKTYTNRVGTSAIPPQGGMVQVQVTLTGKLVWEVSIQLLNCGCI